MFLMLALVTGYDERPAGVLEPPTPAMIAMSRLPLVKPGMADWRVSEVLGLDNHSLLNPKFPFPVFACGGLKTWMEEYQLSPRHRLRLIFHRRQDVMVLYNADLDSE